MAKPSNPVYGLKRDDIDINDRPFMLEMPIKLPSMIDLRPGMPPVYNQGQLGSCTANAIAGCVQYQEIKQGKQDHSNPSRLFIYYNERSMEGTVADDDGAQIRDGIKSLNIWGFADESLWPYSDDTSADSSPFRQKPSASVYAAAKKEVVYDYLRIQQNCLAIKACLAQLHPVVFGIQVYASFESQQVAETGIVPMPKPNEQLMGGHAVLIVGYDDAKQVFIVRNSWGADWGMAGCFSLPYAFVADPNLASDFWTVRKVA